MKSETTQVLKKQPQVRDEKKKHLAVWNMTTNGWFGMTEVDKKLQEYSWMANIKREVVKKRKQKKPKTTCFKVSDWLACSPRRFRGNASQ